MNSYINLNPENIWKIEVYPDEIVCDDIVFVKRRTKVIKPIPFLPFLKFTEYERGGLKYLDWITIINYNLSTFIYGNF